MITKAKFLAFFWTVFFFLLQNSLQLVFPKSTPSFLLILTVFYGLYEGPWFGFILGCWAGFLGELFGVGKLGYQMAIFGFVGSLSGMLSGRISRENLFTQIFLPVLGSYLATLLYVLLYKNSFGEVLSPAILYEAWLPWPFFWTAVASPIFFRFFRVLSAVEKKEKSPKGFQ